MGNIERTYLEKASRDSLIINDRKHRGYLISLTNETMLDRTYAMQFEIDDRPFNCIAHYLFYSKCKMFQLPSEIIDEVYNHYRVVFPLKPTTEVIQYEDFIHDKYFDEFQAVDGNLKALWRKDALEITANCVVDILAQNASFREAMYETKNSIIVEFSKSLFWGIDCESALISEMAHPETWSGFNYYGQALTAARDYYKSVSRKIRKIVGVRKVD